MWTVGLCVLVVLMSIGFYGLTRLWISDPWPDVDQPRVPSPKPPQRVDAVARQQVAAVAALRHAGVDEEWIRTFVTFEAVPDPEPKPIGDNRSLLAELKAALDGPAPASLVPIQPGYQGRRVTQVRCDKHVTLWDMDGNIVDERET